VDIRTVRAVASPDVSFDLLVGDSPHQRNWSCPMAMNTIESTTVKSTALVRAILNTLNDTGQLGYPLIVSTLRYRLGLKGGVISSCTFINHTAPTEGYDDDDNPSANLPRLGGTGTHQGTLSQREKFESCLRTWFERDMFGRSDSTLVQKR